MVRHAPLAKGSIGTAWKRGREKEEPATEPDAALNRQGGDCPSAWIPTNQGRGYSNTLL